MADPFIAQVQIWTTSFTPRGWAICQGSIVSIQQNAALYSVIGNTYGGDGGKDTMRLPKLNGRAVMSWSPSENDKYQIGEAGGHHEATITVDAMPAHTHGTIHGQKGKVNDAGTPSDLVVPSSRGNAQGINQKAYDNYVKESAGNMRDSALSEVGEGAAHENRQPFLALQFCIALTGVYPQRH